MHLLLEQSVRHPNIVKLEAMKETAFNGRQNVSIGPSHGDVSGCINVGIGLKAFFMEYAQGRSFCELGLLLASEEVQQLNGQVDNVCIARRGDGFAKALIVDMDRVGRAQSLGVERDWRSVDINDAGEILSACLDACPSDTLSVEAEKLREYMTEGRQSNVTEVSCAALLQQRQRHKGGPAR
ncbi:unnamed protein product [Vitrella brassicaformis CCMP3155]|uniref:Protein kinase domain-containing protein n=1 Tax=Vitrella brassicaformis (strain CCMP3155) TaxID=1169540 RepID=A0A0G4G0Z9_VITBC|nr:unnamed protein product [Vitrella brassicaformis CCMP3155]|eukprot:CEM21755.1 unnamed protein product [Vitrella brassicaformis CCMP3155]